VFEERICSAREVEDLQLILAHTLASSVVDVAVLARDRVLRPSPGLGISLEECAEHVIGPRFDRE
jgi:hypothetical protein